MKEVIKITDPPRVDCIIETSITAATDTATNAVTAAAAAAATAAVAVATAAAADTKDLTHQRVYMHTRVRTRAVGGSLKRIEHESAATATSVIAAVAA